MGYKIDNKFIDDGIDLSPKSSRGIKILNNLWKKWVNNAGTGDVNVMKVNTSDEIDIGATLNVGPIDLVEDSGAITLVNLPVSSTPSDGDEESYSFAIDSNAILKIKGLADGAGGADSFQLDINAPLFITEQASANVDEAGYGQLWVKNTTPNELWFTDDTGGDYQIANGEAYTFGSLDTSTNTTITTAGTWYPIAGAFTNSPMVNFIFDTDHIEYSGATTKYFKIDWCGTFKGDANGITVKIAIKKNAVVQTATQMATFVKTLNEQFNLCGTAVVELATNDEIQIVVTADTDGDVLTFDYFTTAIHGMH